jgi:hypothetical protein
MLATVTALLGGVMGGEFWVGGWEGVITAIFKESRLKFLDTEKEPPPQLTISSHRFHLFLPGLLE